jgi:hypothetical protein
MTRMNDEKQGVEAFVTDYERDFGVRMPPKDAQRILTLYDEICDLFEKHSPPKGLIPPWFFLP